MEQITAEKRRVVILIVWLGSFPQWMPYYLLSCSKSKLVKWCIIHDAPVDHLAPFKPASVDFIKMSEDELKRRIKGKLGFSPEGRLGYKLCDYRPLYADLFPEIIKDYEYLGWGDIDLVYGNIDRFLAPLLGQTNAISFHRTHLSNHLFIIRNNLHFNGLHTNIKDFSEKLRSPGHLAIDDREYSDIIIREPNVHFSEQFTTPFVNWMPWADGTYNFPTKWLWNQGHVSNNLDRGFEFVYFHFMVWKGGNKDYYIKQDTWENKPAPVPPDAGTHSFVMDVNGLHINTMPPPSIMPFLSDQNRPNRTLLRRLRIKLQTLAGK